MAKSLTGTFTITQQLTATAVGYTTATIPIGSLIDVGDAQALEVESVDYVFQNLTTATQIYGCVAPGFPFSNDNSAGAQLMDRNLGTFLAANDNNLISSGTMNYGYADNIVTNSSDFYPDDFQKTNGRFVVNDEMYFVLQVPINAFGAGQEVSCSVRIRAKVVKLSTRDWMAISLETVQNE